ncbi:LysM peptidoglycan-binding domain-containing protein [Candidatus Falkowbacteria bacterium]|nr:LysM peptidoglycan-binding domain-containing protein [Candidatus Falkowbacteria bacterium]
MKKLTMMFLMVLTFAATASAETYTVKKGDWLNKIAKSYGLKWQKFYKVNKAVVGKNPDKIYPGQKLTVPAKITADFKWQKPGFNPFGGRDFTKAIEKFNLPEEVKKIFIAKVKNGEFEWSSIKVGDRFEQMAFGDYKIINNVIAGWETERLLAGRLYTATVGDKIYFLVDPLICHNWAWWVGETVAIKKEAPPTVMVPPTPPVKEEPKEPTPPVEEKKLMLLIPPPTTVVAEEDPAPTPIKLPTFIWKPAIDVSAFAGTSTRTQGKGEGSYWGVDASLYLFKYRLGDGILEAGPSLQYVGWKGWDYDIPMAADGHWEEYKQLYGVGNRYTKNNTETTLKVRYGEKRGEFKLSEYKNKESNRLLNAELYHTIWFERKWFHDVEVGVRADVDLGGEKKSWWGNSEIPSSNDRRYNQSEYALFVKTELYKWKIVTPTIGVSGVYAKYNDYSGNNWSLVPQVGIKLFDDKFAINTEYQIREGSGNNAVGMGLVMEIDKVLEGLVKWLKNQNNQDNIPVDIK